MTDKIRLLVITDEMEVGGTQRQITRMLTNLDKEKFDCTVVYFRNESFLIEELEAGGINVIKVEKNRKLDFTFISKLRQIIKAGRFDIIHAFAFSGELWGTIVAKSLGLDNIITSVRGTYEWYSGAQWRLKQWISNNSRWVIANSKAGADYAITKMQTEEERFKVVYNGINTPSRLNSVEQANLKATLNIAPELPVIGFVGRLVEHKNVFCLIKALKRLPANSNYRAVIVGDGPLMEKIQHAIAHTLTEKVLLLGERNDVNALVQIFDFVILPSFREGLSNTILEAMIAGRPVIASNVGGNPELIEDNQQGLLFPNDDDQSLAKKIDVLLSDKLLREKLGRAAQLKAEQVFSVEAMVKNMSTIYTNCLVKQE